MTANSTRLSPLALAVASGVVAACRTVPGECYFDSFDESGSCVEIQQDIRVFQGDIEDGLLAYCSAPCINASRVEVSPAVLGRTKIRDVPLLGKIRSIGSLSIRGPVDLDGFQHLRFVEQLDIAVAPTDQLNSLSGLEKVGGATFRDGKARSLDGFPARVIELELNIQNMTELTSVGSVSFMSDGYAYRFGHVDGPDVHLRNLPMLTDLGGLSRLREAHRIRLSSLKSLKDLRQVSVQRMPTFPGLDVADTSIPECEIDRFHQSLELPRPFLASSGNPTECPGVSTP